MKTTKVLVLIFSALLLTVSCKKEDAAAVADAAGGGGATTTTKELLSSNWFVSNSAWSIDLSLGNLTGSTFNMFTTYSNGDRCTCAAILVGTQSAGNYQTTSCVSTNNASGSNTNASCQTVFGYTAVSTYVNSNGLLTMCRGAGGTNCTLVYH